MSFEQPYRHGPDGRPPSQHSAASDWPGAGWSNAGPPNAGPPNAGPPCAGPPSAPGYAPGAHPPKRGPANGSPGWPARILFAAGIVVDVLPSILIYPFIAVGTFDPGQLYAVVAVSTGVLGLLLGVAALMITRSTTWTRRFIGGGVLTVVGIVTIAIPLVLSPALSLWLIDHNIGFWLYRFVFASFSAVWYSALFIAWNIVRNRQWWVHLVAAGCAIVLAAVSAVSQGLTTEPAYYGSAAMMALVIAVTQLIKLALVFAALGLLHVLGRLPSGSVPVDAQPALGEPKSPRPGSVATGYESGYGGSDAGAQGPGYGGSGFGGSGFVGQGPGSQGPSGQWSGGQGPGAQAPGYAPSWNGQPDAPQPGSAPGHGVPSHQGPQPDQGHQVNQSPQGHLGVHPDQRPQGQQGPQPDQRSMSQGFGAQQGAPPVQHRQRDHGAPPRYGSDPQPGSDPGSGPDTPPGQAGPRPPRH